MRIGLLIVLVGCVYLLRNLGYVASIQFDLLWPILLILVGIAMTMRRCRHCGYTGCGGDCRRGKFSSGKKCDCECDACRICVVK